jgi:hypothetical protein
MSARYVTITKDGEEGQCMPSAVKTWERNGWTVVDDGSSESAPEAPAEKEPTGRTKTKE